jgi:hypothetical protein
MIRLVNLVLRLRLQYSIVCSSMISVDLEVGALREILVSLVNAGMVPGLIKCYWMSLYCTVCRGRQQVVTVRPGHSELCTWHTFPKIQDGTWPAPYICCNYCNYS